MQAGHQLNLYCTVQVKSVLVLWCIFRRLQISMGGPVGLHIPRQWGICSLSSLPTLHSSDCQLQYDNDSRVFGFRNLGRQDFFPAATFFCVLCSLRPINMAKPASGLQGFLSEEFNNEAKRKASDRVSPHAHHVPASCPSSHTAGILHALLLPADTRAAHAHCRPPRLTCAC